MSTPDQSAPKHTMIRTFVPELDTITGSKFTFNGKEYKPGDPFPHKTMGVNGGPIERTQLNGLWLAGYIVFIQPSGHALVDGVCPTCGRPPGAIAEQSPTVNLMREFEEDEPDPEEVKAMIAAQRAKLGVAKPVGILDEGVVIDDPTRDEPEADFIEQSSALASVQANGGKLGVNPPPRRKNSPAAKPTT